MCLSPSKGSRTHLREVWRQAIMDTLLWKEDIGYITSDFTSKRTKYLLSRIFMMLPKDGFCFGFCSSGDHKKLNSYVQNRFQAAEAKTKERSIKVANNAMLRKAMWLQGEGWVGDGQSWKNGAHFSPACPGNYLPASLAALCSGRNLLASILDLTSELKVYDQWGRKHWPIQNKNRPYFKCCQMGPS